MLQVTDLHSFCFSGKLVRKPQTAAHGQAPAAPDASPALTGSPGLAAVQDRHRARGLGVASSSEGVLTPLRLLCLRGPVSGKDPLCPPRQTRPGREERLWGAGRRCPFAPLATPPVSLPVTALVGRPLPLSSALLRVGHRCHSFKSQ